MILAKESSHGWQSPLQEPKGIEQVTFSAAIGADENRYGGKRNRRRFAGEALEICQLKLREHGDSIIAHRGAESKLAASHRYSCCGVVEAPPSATQ